MFQAFGKTFYEIGDEVKQPFYPGCKAVVVEVIETPFAGRIITKYRLNIDVKGHPEGFDENEEPVDFKLTLITQENLEIANS